MPDLPLTAADIGIVAVLLLSALLAFARGFVHEMLSVGAWIGAAAAVVFGLPFTRTFARDLVAPPLLADALTGTVLFIAALVLFSMVTRGLSRRVHDSALNAIDRSLGAVFGLARGALIICLAYLPIEWLMPPTEQPPWLRESRSMPLVEQGANWIRSLVKERTPAAVDPLRERLQRNLETERMAREIMSPDPKAPAPAGESQEKGYTEKERRQLERLLEGNR